MKTQFHHGDAENTEEDAGMNFAAQPVDSHVSSRARQ
jgi:hypothetical protein